jgi:hypothetical protein
MPNPPGRRNRGGLGKEMLTVSNLSLIATHQEPISPAPRPFEHLSIAQLRWLRRHENEAIGMRHSRPLDDYVFVDNLIKNELEYRASLARHKRRQRDRQALEARDAAFTQRQTAGVS